MFRVIGVIFGSIALRAPGQYGGTVAGILGMDIPHLEGAHIVAVDELGMVDPADNAPDHMPLGAYVLNRVQDGVVFHAEWLTVRKIPSERLRRQDAGQQRERVDESF
jgi:hypothetical protein